jgi:hypothetical protein
MCYCGSGRDSQHGKNKPDQRDHSPAYRILSFAWTGRTSKYNQQIQID